MLAYPGIPKRSSRLRAAIEEPAHCGRFVRPHAWGDKADRASRPSFSLAFCWSSPACAPTVWPTPMKQNWTLGQGSITPSIRFEIVSVLAEYEGPQILFARINGKECLGVAADEDDVVVRWLFSPVSSVELLALAGGHCSTYAAIVKEGISVVDLDDDLLVREVWEVPVEDLRMDVLPDPSSKLPKEARALLSEFYTPVALPRLTLGIANSHDLLSFRALSGVLSSFQRLWTTLAQSMEGDAVTSRGRWSTTLEERATLHFSQAVPGSLRIEMKAGEQALHDRVSDLFAIMVHFADSPEEQEAINQMLQVGPRAYARLNELLKLVQKSGIELLNENGSTGAYLSPSIAARVLRAGKFEETRTSVMEAASGFFLAFSESDAKFEFYDEARDAVLAGTVDPRVISSHDAVTVGQGGSYAIVVEKVTRQISALRHEVQFTLREIIDSAPSRWMAEGTG